MNLKKLRQQLGKTQLQIAEDLGLPRTMYARYETETSQPDTRTLVLMADYFHTTIDNLVGHSVPYLLDKSVLSETQKEIVDLLPELNEDCSRLVRAYINGLLEGQNDRNSILQRFRK